jgi:hypothetical protein
MTIRTDSQVVPATCCQYAAADKRAEFASILVGQAHAVMRTGLVDAGEFRRAVIPKLCGKRRSRPSRLGRWGRWQREDLVVVVLLKLSFGMAGGATARSSRARELLNAAPPPANTQEEPNDVHPSYVWSPSRVSNGGAVLLHRLTQERRTGISDTVGASKICGARQIFHTTDAGLDARTEDL